MRHLGLALSVLAVLSLGLTADAKKHARKKGAKPHHKTAAKPSTGSHDAANMDLALEIDGKLISRPHVAIVYGEKGMITQNMPDHSMYVLEVTPTRTGAKMIKADFAISKVTQGKTTLIASPKIIALVGEKAEIKQMADGKTLALSMKTSL